jgi:hypothetical protein
MQQDTVVRGPLHRDTGRKRDGKAKGVYWRPRARGGKSWGYYAWGKINSARSRQDAIDAKAKARLDKSAGMPAPDTKVTMRELAEEVREAKRRRLRRSSLRSFEDALDRVVLPEFGHLKPAQVGPDRVARFIRELETRNLTKSTIDKYLQPLNATLALAVRRGVILSNPMLLLSADERPQGGPKRQRFEWSPEAISKLISAAEALANGRRPGAATRL